MMQCRTPTLTVRYTSMFSNRETVKLAKKFKNESNSRFRVWQYKSSMGTKLALDGVSTSVTTDPDKANLVKSLSYQM